METPPNWVFSKTVNPRATKLGTHMQGLNTNSPAKFQGHPPIITLLPPTCVLFKVIEQKM